jgi:SHS2 domain-containing protein
MLVKFEYLDHTADLKIRASGKTLEEAFENVALGAFNFLTDIEKVEKKSIKKISKSSSRLDSLLYDFLEELLFLLDTDGLLFCGCKKLVISRSSDGTYALSGSIQGDSYKNYPMKGDIKAITYSDMKIEEKDGQFVITAVFDI